MRPLTSRPPHRTMTFGPGSLEMISATTWTSPGGGKIRVRGLFDVSGGNGHTHRIRIDETAYIDDLRRLDIVDIAGAADHLIGGYLDDEWFDPCEEIT